MTAKLASVALFALAGCGARTPLDFGPQADGGPGPLPLEISCFAAGGQYSAPDEPIELVARVEGGIAPVFAGWHVVIEPEGSAAEPAPADSPTATFTPSIVGGYQLRASFQDGADRADCTVEVQVALRPFVDCGDEERTAPAGTNLILSVDASGAEPLTIRWAVEERPTGSLATPDPDGEPTVTFRPDLAGQYVVGVQVRDRFGQTASCNVGVTATRDPTRIECDDVETEPLETVTLGVRYLGEGIPQSYAWSIEGAPDGSSAAPPAPPDSAMPRFTPDLAGDYVVQVRVESSLGETFECVLTVHAFPTEALRIEMFWNPPDRSCSGGGDPDCDDSDVDLHLLHPDGDAWFNGRFDCHYANCDGGLAWDGPGTDDDAFLELDDTSGFGPENINVEAPAGGTYRVGVHLYDDGDRWDAPVSVTVRVYCGTDPPVEYGPRSLSADDASAGNNDFWKVADVTFASGACSLAAIDAVVTTVDARNAR